LITAIRLEPQVVTRIDLVEAILPVPKNGDKAMR
jgi:hypothetical protein